ncbi:MAG TPA: bifunctional demethylmenaquinone methyltransferase/2-methoxy-6-polyprenyl-1,4-benzoquinol methylase UbiE [Gammaproteobacteria bacterium]|nr:bifunctional demethylmenaquinone methyltransferase/2-methoxy-6-polyprenyl-1,4-benzoquinol methylase UbiE [Gammaproteobacteria bacterium]
MKPDDPSEKTQSTDFGYQQVSFAEKTAKVAQVFHSVADKYDMMNDLMSLGVHRLWKRYTVELANVRAGQQVLDLAGGTGDLAKQFAKKVGSQGAVVLADINEAMLKKGRERLIDKGIVGNISYAQVNAEALPFPDNHFDLITIAFGLRNVTHKEIALKEMYRVLKPGGKALILEFSKVTVPGLASLYDAWSFKMLPFLGQMVAKDADSYRYLAESVRKHPNQETLRVMLETAGFENCDYHNLTGGIVAIHRGYKS